MPTPTVGLSCISTLLIMCLSLAPLLYCTIDLSFCAPDYDANAVASTNCQTFNAAGCTQYGFSMDSATECNDMPPQLCARIGGNVTTTSCGDVVNTFDQMTNSQTQHQICSSGLRISVAHFEVSFAKYHIYLLKLQPEICTA